MFTERAVLIELFQTCTHKELLTWPNLSVHMKKTRLRERIYLKLNRAVAESGWMVGLLIV